ncbi:hypothetical protein [Streptomyces sp. AC550_RSS872]|uniref:hypothetical protein n=1 Tax=Streptomyces sp. AC550_RSS872 TaxID=2823689 RepID=UPI001C276B4A|nr:hypothetical protein [Streptomyces sp. AC550_RSS872]
MRTSTSPKGRRLRNRSLGVLLAGGAGLGLVATTGVPAYASLNNSDGSLTPVFVQGGSVSIPDQANSIKITVPGTGSFCTARPSDRSANISTGTQLSEGNQFTIDAYSDSACQGTSVGGIGYTATYNGPDPRSGKFTRVQVRVRNAAMFVCTDGGWTDGNPAGCRQG